VRGVLEFVCEARHEPVIRGFARGRRGVRAEQLAVGCLVPLGRVSEREIVGILHAGSDLEHRRRVPAGIGVRLGAVQAIEVAGLRIQEPKHVVKGAVLQHYQYHMVNRIESSHFYPLWVALVRQNRGL